MALYVRPSASTMPCRDNFVLALSRDHILTASEARKVETVISGKLGMYAFDALPYYHQNFVADARKAANVRVAECRQVCSLLAKFFAGQDQAPAAQAWDAIAHALTSTKRLHETPAPLDWDDFEPVLGITEETRMETQRTYRGFAMMIVKHTGAPTLRVALTQPLDFERSMVSTGMAPASINNIARFAARLVAHDASTQSEWQAVAARFADFKDDMRTRAREQTRTYEELDAMLEDERIPLSGRIYLGIGLRVVASRTSDLFKVRLLDEAPDGEALGTPPCYIYPLRGEEAFMLVMRNTKANSFCERVLDPLVMDLVRVAFATHNAGYLLVGARGEAIADPDHFLGYHGLPKGNELRRAVATHLLGDLKAAMEGPMIQAAARLSEDFGPFYDTVSAYARRAGTTTQYLFDTYITQFGATVDIDRQLAHFMHAIYLARGVCDAWQRSLMCTEVLASSDNEPEDLDEDAASSPASKRPRLIPVAHVDAPVEGTAHEGIVDLHEAFRVDAEGMLVPSFTHVEIKNSTADDSCDQVMADLHVLKALQIFCAYDARGAPADDPRARYESLAQVEIQLTHTLATQGWIPSGGGIYCRMGGDDDGYARAFLVAISAAPASAPASAP